MTDATVRLTDEQAGQLAQEAQKLGVSAKAFLQAARHILSKNSELYQRLS